MNKSLHSCAVCTKSSLQISGKIFAIKSPLESLFMKLLFVPMVVLTSIVVVGCHSDSDRRSQKLCQKHYKAESYKVALKKCLVGAENGNIDSQWLLANLYSKGLAGEKDKSKAAFWLNRAAENGHTAAQRELGKAYLWGNGIEHNPEQALHWFKLAARDNDTEAEFLIGIFYLGDGKRESDQASAMNWFKRAAASGHRMAINNLAWLYSTSPNPSLRNGKRAVEIMQPLIKKSPESSVLLDTLAAAYAESGEFEQAVSNQQMAVDNLKEKIGGTARQGYLDRLASYQQGKPWRESLPDWSANDVSDEAAEDAASEDKSDTDRSDTENHKAKQSRADGSMDPTADYADSADNQS